MKETEWDKEWFININGIWKSKRNQRIFLEHLQQKLHIKNPMEWGKISKRELKENGAIALIRDYYDGSIYKALKSVFSGEIT